MIQVIWNPVDSRRPVVTCHLFLGHVSNVLNMFLREDVIPRVTPCFAGRFFGPTNENEPQIGTLPDDGCDQRPVNPVGQIADVSNRVRSGRDLRLRVEKRLRDAEGEVADVVGTIGVTLRERVDLVTREAQDEARAPNKLVLLGFNPFGPLGPIQSVVVQVVVDETVVGKRACPRLRKRPGCDHPRRGPVRADEFLVPGLDDALHVRTDEGFQVTRISRRKNARREVEVGSGRRVWPGGRMVPVHVPVAGGRCVNGSVVREGVGQGAHPWLVAGEEQERSGLLGCWW
jgi:hypothetical protein